jgi:galactitol-specific phosphotransferase system IIC component
MTTATHQPIRLTRRGRIVRAILITVLALAVFSWVDGKITPAECKVPASEMSQGCKDLIYP